MALQSWQLTNLHIHTDSKLILKLLEGGLLELENGGWQDPPWVAFPPNSPPLLMRNMLKHLLHLVRAHQGKLTATWVKAHTGHHLNEAADEAAKAALLCEDTIHLPDLWAPAGWTDATPMLGGRTLALVTKCVVWDGTIPPLLEARCAPFLTQWATHLRRMTGLTLDTGLHAPRVWKLNIPPRLCKLLWKDMTGSLPIGPSWFGNMEHGRTCSYGMTMTLTHVWTSC